MSRKGSNTAIDIWLNVRLLTQHAKGMSLQGGTELSNTSGDQRAIFSEPDSEVTMYRP